MRNEAVWERAYQEPDPHLEGGHMTCQDTHMEPAEQMNYGDVKVSSVYYVLITISQGVV